MPDNLSLCVHSIVKEVSGQLKPPLIFDGETKVTKGGSLLSPLSIFNGRLFASSKNYLVCYDLESSDIIWQREEKSMIGNPKAGEKNRIYLYLSNGPACLDARTNQVIWSGSGAPNEWIVSESEKTIFYIDNDIEPEPLICRSKSTGKEIWRLIETHGFPSKVAIEREVVVIMGSKGFHVCKEPTGELLWDATNEEWLKKYFPDRSFGHCTMGPLIDGVLYVGYDGDTGGLLVAIEIESGKIYWSYELEKPHCPATIIFSGDKLYFSIDQGWGSNNYLSCVDAKSGRLIYQTEENITVAGCVNPIMVNNYFIGGMGQYLSFFDIERREFVWRYKHKKKKSIFGGAICVYNDQLITYDNSEKEIYWFRCKPQKK